MTGWIASPRAKLLGAGLLLITLGVLLVGTASQTTVVTANQRLADYWRTTYDILVRPAGSRSPIEEKYGLVEANHLSGIWGGITFEQYETIQIIPGIEVAAPIAMLGYGPALGRLPLNPPTEAGVYILEVSVSVDNGTNVMSPPGFPQRTYYYFSQPPKTIPLGKLPQFIGSLVVDPPVFDQLQGLVDFPMFFAGIDPYQEAALVGLDQSLLKGQYLNGNEPLESPYEVAPSEGAPSQPQLEVPVLINATNYIRATAHAELKHVLVPPDINTPEQILSHGGPEFLDGLPQEVLDEVTLNSDMLYQRMIEEISGSNPQRLIGGIGTQNIASALTYQEDSFPGWHNELVLALQVPENFDESHPVYRSTSPASYKAMYFWKVKGIFDINNIPRPISVNQIPLETYFPPTAILRYDEQGRPVEPPRTLRPTLNPAGYIQPPPMVLTTLEAARALRGDDAISAIRVRVALEDCSEDYLTCPLTPQNQRKIETIASEIARRTGLDVDIMVGSSPTRVLVHVPGVGYVEEQWIQKNVSLTYRKKIQSGHLLLLGTLLGVGALFSLDLAWAEVVARRREIALQKALGWRSSTVFRQVLGGLLAVEVVAAALGALLAWGATALLGWKPPSPSLLVGVPLLVVALSALGGLYPAGLAARLPPVLSLRPGPLRVPGNRRLSLPVSGLVGLAWQGMTRRWSRSALGALTAAFSAALLVLLLAVTVDRQGALSGTLLGEFILVQIEGYHFAIVGMGFVLAALSLANSLLAGVLERRREIGVLKAVGCAPAK